jgi:hypothetical protein
MRLRRVYFLIVLILLPLWLWQASPPATAQVGDPLLGEHAFFPPRPARPATDDPHPSHEQPSAFMAGHVAVQAIFVESDGTVEPSTEDWRPEQITAIHSQIAEALDWWRIQLPNARLSFDLTVRTVGSRYEPIGNDLMNEGLWIGDVLTRIGSPGTNYFEQAYDADDELRHAQQADWATTIFVVNSTNDVDGRFADGPFAYAYIGGPFMVITSDSGPYGVGQLAPVIAHELGHIFGALDQYASAQVPCTQASGYLSVPTTNSQLDDCGTRFSSIMLDPVPAYSGGYIDASALGQIGYQDSEQNGLPDPIDTAPTLQAGLTSPPGGGRPLAAGLAVDQPHPSIAGPAVTINTIARIEYRVDGGDWIILPPADGAYDSASESITTTLPLYDGQHNVELRAVNSVGAVSPLVQQTVMVNGVGAAPAYAVAVPKFSTSLDITMTLAAPAGSFMQISSEPFFKGASWMALSKTSWRLSPTDGPHTLYIRFRDQNSIESPLFVRTVTLDRKAPSGSAVIHRSATPWLEIQAEDEVSGVVGVQVGDSASPSTWQPFQPTVLITGTLGMQVRLRDAAGNISNPIPIHHPIYLPLVSMP